VGALHIQRRANKELLDTTILPHADRQQIEVTAHVTKDGRLRLSEIPATLATVGFCGAMPSSPK